MPKLSGQLQLDCHCGLEKNKNLTLWFIGNTRGMPTRAIAVGPIFRTRPERLIEYGGVWPFQAPDFFDP
jgi:hypothetical protein